MTDQNAKSRSVVELPIGSLQPYSCNARTHSKKQIRQVAASIQRFGFVNPILVNEKGEIIAGHGRVEAAGEMPIELGRTVCQRTNLRYDSHLRRSYGAAILIVVAVVLIGLLVAGLLQDLNLTTWILTLNHQLGLRHNAIPTC